MKTKQIQARAEKLLNQWVTEIVREIQLERCRMQAVERLDKVCEPYIKDEVFMAWVMEREKTWGESDYSKLTLEDCEKWIDGVRQWVQANGKPYNVNPSGQAGVAWAL